eukprot:7388883-Prymnesium_polylepis.2
MQHAANLASPYAVSPHFLTSSSPSQVIWFYSRPWTGQQTGMSMSCRLKMRTMHMRWLRKLLRSSRASACNLIPSWPHAEHKLARLGGSPSSLIADSSKVNEEKLVELALNGEKQEKAQEGPRLDDFGYLRHEPTDRGCLPSAWIGESIGKGVEKLYTDDADGEDIEVDYYGGVDYGGLEIKLRDAVYLEPEAQGEACEVGMVHSLYAVKDEDAPKRMTVQWYWRPEALKEAWVDEGMDPVKFNPVEAAPYELFLSDCRDAHNSIDMIETCGLSRTHADRPRSVRRTNMQTGSWRARCGSDAWTTDTWHAENYEKASTAARSAAFHAHPAKRRDLEVGHAMRARSKRSLRPRALVRFRCFFCAVAVNEADSRSARMYSASQDCFKPTFMSICLCSCMSSPKKKMGCQEL